MEFIANAAMIAEEGERLGVVTITITTYAIKVKTPIALPFTNAFFALRLR
jgi:hypothetical protein